MIRVGEGRGFLVEWPRDLTRVVITAAHCLPWLPDTAHPAAYAEEHTYANLLGPLGDADALWCVLQAFRLTLTELDESIDVGAELLGTLQSRTVVVVRPLGDYEYRLATLTRYRDRCETLSPAGER